MWNKNPWQYMVALSIFVGLTMKNKRIGLSGENHQVRGPPKYLALMAKPNIKSQPKQPIRAN